MDDTATREIEQLEQKLAAIQQTIKDAQELIERSCPGVTALAAELEAKKIAEFERTRTKTLPYDTANLSDRQQTLTEGQLIHINAERERAVLEGASKQIISSNQQAKLDGEREIYPQLKKGALIRGIRQLETVLSEEGAGDTRLVLEAELARMKTELSQIDAPSPTPMAAAINPLDDMARNPTIAVDMATQVEAAQ